MRSIWMHRGYQSAQGQGPHGEAARSTESDGQAPHALAAAREPASPSPEQSRLWGPGHEDYDEAIDSYTRLGF